MALASFSKRKSLLLCNNICKSHLLRYSFHLFPSLSRSFSSSEAIRASHPGVKISCIQENVGCFPSKVTQFTIHSFPRNVTSPWLRFLSSASPQSSEKETDQFKDEQGTVGDKDEKSQNISEDEMRSESTKGSVDSKASDQAGGSGSSSDPQSIKKKTRSAKQTAFSDPDADSDLSVDDLVKLLAEREELLKTKHEEVQQMQDKVLRTYAEMENVIDRTKREAGNSKKFAIQSFAKSLLDVADNLERAASVVKDSFSKIDQSKDSVGAVPLLKTLLEGVEMTNKQLMEVFRKFGAEKFDPMNEQFDPNRHYAVFQVPDASKPPGTVAAVLKAGYMLHDRVLRPAEVGVTQALDDGAADQHSVA